MRLLQTIGVKVQRAHFNPRIVSVPATPQGALPLDFSEQDAAFAEARQHETWVLPIAGYAFEGTKSKLATDANMHGPPRDFDEFVQTWERILRRYPQIETVEFWNEPWIFGWTWAGTPAEYRDLQTRWTRMARRVNPKLRLLAGNSSMFTEDHIELYPASWKGLLDGTTHHPYSGAGEATMRDGAQGRSIDHGAVVTRRMGLPFYYLTEGGTEWREPGRAANDKNNAANARKLVQYSVRAALAGAYQSNVQWEIGYGPQWTRGNAAHAVMTHWLEDRPVVADIWPQNELIWGAVFAHPRHVTPAVRRLPRAAELASRWNVPIPAERAGDATKVAVVWGHTGQSNNKVDEYGTITLSADDVRAFDLTGREVEPHDGVLSLHFSENPLYITSERLSVEQLRERVGQAHIHCATPQNLSALSLMRPANEEQTLRVRLQNQLNREVSGTLRMDSPRGQTSAPFRARAGELIEVPIEWRAVTGPARSDYPVTLVAETKSHSVWHVQKIAVARFARRTIQVDGTLSGWEGVTPVVLDSVSQSGVDLTPYLLNPNLKRPASAEPGRVTARVYTAYDDRNIYIAAAVNEAKLSNEAGRPARRGKATLPYRQGVPDGLEYIRNTGDTFLFSFGFRDRVPGWGRQMNDPWAWKGHFYDTDYHYAAHVSTDGPQLVRQWGPDTGRRIAYQIDPIPGVGPVAGAKIQISRDEALQITTYEMAIPRSEIALFDPAKERLRFGFVLANDEGAGTGGVLQWSQTAGVFDHWRSSGSFGPSWSSVLPCQTFFGIER